MPRQIKQQVIDDINIIIAEFPNPNQQGPVIEGYLAQIVRKGERIIEDV